MDHAPGQRQFTSIDAYAVYYTAKEDDPGSSTTSASAASRSRRRQFEPEPDHADPGLPRARDHPGEPRRRHARPCRGSPEQGIRVAEFPTTHQAAAASREAGMAELMGAPNVMRGGSHSRQRVGPVARRERPSRHPVVGHKSPSASSSRPSSSARWSTRSRCRNPWRWCRKPRRSRSGSTTAADRGGETRRPRARAPRRSRAGGARRLAEGVRSHERDRPRSLIAVVGPSGAGKDTLLDAARVLLAERWAAAASSSSAGHHEASDASAEDHDTMDADRFETARAAGAFVVTWEAHGLAYGLPSRPST